VPAGPIWNNEDAQTKAPVVAASYNGKWNGQWRTIMSPCGKHETGEATLS